MADEIGQTIGAALGFLICLGILVAAYSAGSAFATYVVGESHREASGLLSALALVWFYEHSRWEARWSNRGSEGLGR